MIRTAILFGIWAALCMAATIAGFFIVSDAWDGGGLALVDKDSLRAIAFLSMFSPVAGIVAGLMWALFHRKGYAPGWLAYALLALLVVLVSNMLVFGGMFAIGSDDPLRDFVGAAFGFVIHGWLSVPVAFLGTALFVLWTRRRKAGAPA